MAAEGTLDVSSKSRSGKFTAVLPLPLYAIFCGLENFITQVAFHVFRPEDLRFALCSIFGPLCGN